MPHSTDVNCNAVTSVFYNIGLEVVLVPRFIPLFFTPELISASIRRGLASITLIMKQTTDFSQAVLFGNEIQLKGQCFSFFALSIFLEEAGLE